MSQRDKLIIFDTTLRDGEQSPGASMTRDEKVRIAKALERLRVDVIEAGFPIASQGDFEGVQAVARVVKDSTVCGLARALEKDIDRAGEAGVTLSKYVRSATLGLQLRHRYDQLANRQLHRIGVLLNQAVRHMHQGHFSEETRAAFERSLKALRQELEE